MKVERLVLDTNVLISAALSPAGVPALLLDHLHRSPAGVGPFCLTLNRDLTQHMGVTEPPRHKIWWLQGIRCEVKDFQSGAVPATVGGEFSGAEGATDD